MRELKDELKKYDAEIMKEWDHEMTWYTMLVKNEHM